MDYLNKACGAIVVCRPQMGNPCSRTKLGEPVENMGIGSRTTSGGTHPCSRTFQLFPLAVCAGRKLLACSISDIFSQLCLIELSFASNPHRGEKYLGKTNTIRKASNNGTDIDENLYSYIYLQPGKEFHTLYSYGRKPIPFCRIVLRQSC